MTSNANRERSEGFLGSLRAAAMIAIVAGGGSSVGLMLRVGHRNKSVILLLLFGIWVLSPFVALVLARVPSNRWPPLHRATLYWVTLVVTLGSLSIYGDVAFGPPRPQPAFAFLMVPLASWLLIAIVLPVAAFITGRQSRQDR